MRSLKHIDAVLMGGETPLTKGSVAKSILDEALFPSTYTNAFTKGMLDTVKPAYDHKGVLVSGNPDAYAALVNPTKGVSGIARMAELGTRLQKKHRLYKKNLGERRRLALALGGLVAGTGAGTGVAMNQLIDSLKEKRASKLRKGLKRSSKALLKRLRLDAGRASPFSKGTLGARRRLTRGIERSVYGKRPGALRKKLLEKRKEIMVKDLRRLKSFSSGALKDIRKAVHSNKAVLPTAIGGAAVVGTASVLKDKPKK